jgi:hypothetical protein
MKTFFEYLYYRIAKLNFVKDFERATISVTVCQTLIIVNVIFFLIYGPFEIHGKLNNYEYFGFLAIFFGLDYYNNKLYKGRFEAFDQKWGNEPKKDKIIGMIKVISFIILCWGLFFINGWIYDRYQQ